ncbi:MADF domain-containing protein, partial [Nephila pilipes]
MEWSDENVLELIRIYKTKSILWDLKHEDRSKKNLKKDAWEEISAEMNISVDQCKRKITSMLASYRREKNKIKSNKDTGNGKNENYESRWFAYEALAFLGDRDLSRKRFTTETCEMHEIEDDCEARVASSEQRKQEETALSSTRKSSRRAKGKDANFSVMNSAAAISKNAEDDSEVGVTPSEQRKQEETASSSTRKSYRRAKGKGKDMNPSVMNNAAAISKNA